MLSSRLPCRGFRQAWRSGPAHRPAARVPACRCRTRTPAGRRPVWAAPAHGHAAPDAAHGPPGVPPPPQPFGWAAALLALSYLTRSHQGVDAAPDAANRMAGHPPPPPPPTQGNSHYLDSPTEGKLMQKPREALCRGRQQSVIASLGQQRATYSGIGPVWPRGKLPVPCW